MGFEDDMGYVRGQSSYDEDSMREIEMEIEEERLNATVGFADDEPSSFDDDLPYDDFPEWIPEDDSPLISNVTLNGVPVSDDFDPLEDDDDEEEVEDDGILEDDDEKFY